MKYFAGVFLVALFLSSCASRAPLLVTHPLLETTVRSLDGVFTGNVPRGWYAAGGDTMPQGVTAWLLRDSLTAALAVKEISLDRASAQQVREEGLHFLAEISLRFHDGNNLHSAGIPITEFTVNGKKLFGYELRKKEGDWKSVIVFTVRSRYYECEVISSDASTEITKTILAAQQAFLSSLR